MTSGFSGKNYSCAPRQSLTRIAWPAHHQASQRCDSRVFIRSTFDWHERRTLLILLRLCSLSRSLSNVREMVLCIRGYYHQQQPKSKQRQKRRRTMTIVTSLCRVSAIVLFFAVSATASVI